MGVDMVGMVQVATCHLFLSLCNLKNGHRKLIEFLFSNQQDYLTKKSPLQRSSKVVRDMVLLLMKSVLSY